MKKESKVPLLFKSIPTPPESDLYELAAGRVMNIISMLEFNKSEIVPSTEQRSSNECIVSINSEVVVLVYDLYDQTAEPLDAFVLTSAIIGVIEACVHLNTPLSLKSGISGQLAKLMRSYKNCNC